LSAAFVIRRGLRMAGIFLSYDRDDANAARVIATALETAGHSVWWDLHVRGGAQFSKVIEEALKAADAVVVLWSVNSIESAWVRDEAAAGRDSGRLIPASIDGTEAPLGFRQFQTIDLTDWKRGIRGRGCKQLQQAIAESLEVPADATVGEVRVAPSAQLRAATQRSRKSPFWLTLPALAVPLLGALLFGFLHFGRSSASAPVVSVTAADPSPSSQALARDLLVKLGTLWAARTDAMKLTAAPRRRGDADYALEAAGTNLSLMAKDGALLWSKDFESEAPNRTALEQSMAYNAGQVLDCALQANAPNEPRLQEETLKLFLNGCALFGELYWGDQQSVIPILSQVVAAAPKFQPAWAKLLLSEAIQTRGQLVFYRRFVPGDLPNHIRAVAALNPKLPELYVAQSALLPLHAFEQRYRLIDKAVQLNPHDPDLWVVDAECLYWVGRNNDSIEAARRATELNPLSPGLRGVLIQMLTYAGQLPAAEQELRAAKQLWPGSASITDAEFRFSSRFGDAREALRILHSPEFHPPYRTGEMEAYLQARIQPTPANIQRAIAATTAQSVPEARRLPGLMLLLAELGRNDQAYALLMRLPREEIPQGLFFRPTFRKFREDPRFMQLAARAGLVGFWEHTGKWPDFCFEPNLPYDCKAEAAKLGN
jgi:tetratricopeptide (TPR) repeat protein